MNVIIIVSLMGVIVSPNPQSAQVNPISQLTQESYSGVSINDIAPAWQVSAGASSSVSSRADKWIREQRESAAFYMPPGSGNGRRVYCGATIVLPPRARGRGKPPCVPEVSTTLTLAAGGLGLFYTRRRLKISRN